MFSNMCNKLDIIDIYAPTWEGVLDYTICIYSHVTYGLFVWCWDTYTLTYNKSNLLFHNNPNKNTPFHLTSTNSFQEIPNHNWEIFAISMRKGSKMDFPQ